MNGFEDTRRMESKLFNYMDSKTFPLIDSKKGNGSLGSNRDSLNGFEAGLGIVDSKYFLSMDSKQREYDRVERRSSRGYEAWPPDGFEHRLHLWIRT